MNAYIFQAALLCENCGDAILAAARIAGLEVTEDSDRFPQGPYTDGGGEADSPQHCDHCGTFLENPLTDDGRAYVKKQLTGRGPHICPEWRAFYDIS